MNSSNTDLLQLLERALRAGPTSRANRRRVNALMEAARRRGLLTERLHDSAAYPTIAKLVKAGAWKAKGETA